MDIREVMIEQTDVVEANTSVQGIAALMRRAGASALPVCEGDRLVGVVTDRDIVYYAAEGHDPRVVRAQEVMTPSTKCCFDDDDVHAAAEAMQDAGVWLVPVVTHGRKLVGMVSLADLLAAEEELERQARPSFEAPLAPRRPSRPAPATGLGSIPLRRLA